MFVGQIVRATYICFDRGSGEMGYRHDKGENSRAGALATVGFSKGNVRYSSQLLVRSEWELHAR